jgi:regulator of protease activity HflC (stomatin/prohibitin superfamily)
VIFRLGRLVAARGPGIIYVIPLIERMATKLKKIDDGTLSGFEINIGITAGVPVLYATGGLTLTYKVS